MGIFEKCVCVGGEVELLLRTAIAVRERQVCQRGKVEFDSGTRCG